MHRQAGRQAGDLGSLTWAFAMDLPWVTLDKSLPSLGLSLQPVCALRGLVFYKVVFELGGSPGNGA